jgi:hypothetical protein
MRVFGKTLSDDPVTALQELADLGLIPQPVYTATTLKDKQIKVVVNFPDHPNEGIHGAAVKPQYEHAKVAAAKELRKAVVKRLGLCPTPDRPSYETQEEARRAVKVWQRFPKGHPKRWAFKCDCGAWHTTGKKR